jgi:hypothetical protein
MNRHKRFGNEVGATLLIVIGIIAALAVMASTLVFVIGNMQANTADTRVRDKASGVGEAAMDGQMYQLALNWPDSATPTTAPTLDASRIGQQFSDTSEFPRPATGSFVAAAYYDNSDTNGDGQVSSADAQWDANDDDLMYVEGQGNVGKRSARFQALVKRTYVNTTFPKGIAVYDGGNMASNGGGNNPKITVYFDDGGGVSSYVNGSVTTSEVFDSQSMDVNIAAEGDAIPPIDTLIPQSLIRQVIAMAKGMGRYYDITQGASMPTDFSGVCVIRVQDGATVFLGNSGGINMGDGPSTVPTATDRPGILVILGGPHVQIDIGGNQNFYGIMYTDGQLVEAHGNPCFYGMVVCKSYMDMRGTADIKYDATAITKLADRWTLSVVVVPNTWREIAPQ